jgi:hypothetical protein
MDGVYQTMFSEFVNFDEASAALCIVALHLIAGPAVKTTTMGGVYYTMFPERVTFDEASAACARLPNGTLAILDDRPSLDEAYRSLLQTLPTQTAVQSAWIGAVGVNTMFNPDAPNHTGLASQPKGEPLFLPVLL